MKWLTKKQQESYENAKICYICKEKLKDKYPADKKYFKVRDHCHYTSKCKGSAYSRVSHRVGVPPISLFFWPPLLIKADAPHDTQPT